MNSSVTDAKLAFTPPYFSPLDMVFRFAGAMAFGGLGSWIVVVCVRQGAPLGRALLCGSLLWVVGLGVLLTDRRIVVDTQQRKVILWRTYFFVFCRGTRILRFDDIVHVKMTSTVDIISALPKSTVCLVTKDRKKVFVMWAFEADDVSDAADRLKAAIMGVPVARSEGSARKPDQG